MRLRTVFPAMFVLFLGLLATLVLTRLVHIEADAAVRRGFQDKASAIQDAIRDVMTAYKQILRAAGGLFWTNVSVSGQDWHVFVKSLQLDKDFVGADAMGYAKALRPEEVATYAGMGGRIYPQGSRPFYAPIKFIEPDISACHCVIGFDGVADPTHRAAMERARDMGEASLTGKVVLTKEQGEENSAPSVLLYFPLYEGGTVHPVLDERRAKLRGFVFGAFRMPAFLSASLSKQIPDWNNVVRIRLFDGPESRPEALLFDSRVGPEAGGAATIVRPRFNTVRTFDIAGRQWRMEITALPSTEDPSASRVSRTVLANGIMISVLMAGVVASLSYAHFRSEEAHKRLALEVERRQHAQAQVEFINRELIHRVKNTLAIVSAIATQTKRYSSSLEEFGASFRSRLLALARVQDLLRPDPAHAVGVGTLIRCVLTPYSADDSRLRATGPDVAIPSNAAVLLSLLFNELATNATKYGAWATAAGKVEVQWWIEAGESQGENMSVKWIERGGPPVPVAPKSGFGMNVMKFTIERGLGGTVTASFEPVGVSYAMRFPRLANSARANTDISV